MTTLAEETPFAAVVNDRALDAACSACFALKGRGSPDISRCIGCRTVYYCSKDCQKKDWANHKHECRLLKECSPHIPPKICRLIARVVFKLERSDARTAAFNGRIYEDMMDHGEEIQKDQERMNEFSTFSRILRKYMGEKHVSRRDVLRSIYGKIVTNSVQIGEDPTFIGTGLYVGLSAQNHSCDPDAFIVFDGSTAILRSPRVKEYSKDVTVPYIDLLSTKLVRQRELRSKYYFTCTCAVCSDPTEDFLRNSASSSCCPDSYCLLYPSASQLKCFKCGAPSEISVKEAILANESAIRVWCTLEVEKLDTPAELEAISYGHNAYSKLLSPLNVNLLRLTDKLFNLAFGFDDHPSCIKHAPNIIMAYRRYLSVGNPVLSLRLMNVATSLAEVITSGWILELLEEAVATSILTYGPRKPHSLTRDVEMVLTIYRMKLQMNIFA